MRRTWPFLLAVVVLGVLTGSLIAGLPEAGDRLVIDPASIVDSSSSTLSTAPVLSNTTSTAVATASEPPPAAGSQPTVDASTTTSVLPSTTTSPTATGDTTTTAPKDVDRSTLRLVVANADGRSGLATSTANRMTSLGYGRIDLGDSPHDLEFTMIYYRPAFLTAAATVARDLGIPNVPLLELPADLTTPLTNSDAFGDVIILLGADAPG